MGILWQFSGQDSALSLSWVQSLVGELISRKPCAAQPKKILKLKNKINKQKGVHKIYIQCEPTFIVAMNVM